MKKFTTLALLLILPLALTSCRKKAAEMQAATSSGTTASRIVSLSPAGTEILCGVGAGGQIVARTDFCDFPPYIQELPSVGGFSGETLSIETILFYRPDFVYGTRGIHDSIAQLLEQAGINVYLSQVNSVQDVLNEICVIGSLTGHAQESLACYNRIKTVFSEVEEIVAHSERPLVYYEVWNAPFMSIGSKSYIAGLVHSAGGTNVFQDIAEEYPLVNEEAVVARGPQVIIIPDMNGESTRSISGRHGWSIIPAVQEGRIYFAESNVFSRPGPRMTEALVMIAQMIHPELDFSGIDAAVLTE